MASGAHDHPDLQKQIDDLKAAGTTPPVTPPITPPVEPPITPPTGGNTKTARSVADIKALLLDNSVDVIEVASGKYGISPAQGKGSTALWMGSAYAGRSRPVTVREAVPGGVTFDLGGAGYAVGIAFEEGVHHQTWEGFGFANGRPTSTGTIIFGGYAGMDPPHDITLRKTRFLASVTGAIPQDHSLYVSACSAGRGGPHHLLFEDLDGDGAGGLMSMFNYGHNLVEGAAADNGHHITVRRMKAKNYNSTIVVWEGKLTDLLWEDGQISNSVRFAARYENSGDQRVVFRRMTSIGSKSQGFYSSKANPDSGPPPGVTFDSCSWR